MEKRLIFIFSFILAGCSIINQPTNPSILTPLLPTEFTPSLQSTKSISGQKTLVDKQELTVLPLTETLTITPTKTLAPSTSTIEIEPSKTITPPILEFVQEPTKQNYCNYEKFTPLDAEVSESKWKGVSLKLALINENSDIIALDNGKVLHSFHDKEQATNLYFLTNVKDITKNVNLSKAFIKVTFSDGNEIVVDQGSLKTKSLKYYKIIQSSNILFCPLSQLTFSFYKPKLGMQIIELDIADDPSMKDKLIVLYKK